jgi:uncharacterized protein YkwD
MKHIVPAVLLAFVLLLTSCPGGGSDSGNNLPDPNPGTNPTQDIQAMLGRHNDTRTGLGRAALTVDATLAQIAQSHAQYMASSGNLSHTDGDGNGVDDRADNAGYNWSFIGENISRAGSGEQAYQFWLGSTGHYANITNEDYSDIGIGLVEVGGVQYWCVVFGSR